MAMKLSMTPERSPVLAGADTETNTLTNRLISKANLVRMVATSQLILEKRASRDFPVPPGLDFNEPMDSLKIL